MSSPPGRVALPEVVEGRLRSALPEPVLERVRLLLARRRERRLRLSATPRGAAMVFHSVAPHGGDPTLELDPPLHVSRLDAVVGYLARHYAPVRAADLPSTALARKPGEPLPVAVTFDDDLASHREYAAPIFERHGVVATAFLCGASSPFWWQLLQSCIDARTISADALSPLEPDLVRPALERVPGAIGRVAKAIEDLDTTQRDRVTERLRRATPGRESLLGAEGVAALAAAGWEIGFHTRRHDLLTNLSDDALRAALDSDGEVLLGTPLRTLAFPHGKATEREAQAARDAGFVAAYTGRAEVFTAQTDVHLIGRLQPDTDTPGRFALQLARALDVE